MFRKHASGIAAVIAMSLAAGAAAQTDSLPPLPPGHYAPDKQPDIQQQAATAPATDSTSSSTGSSMGSSMGDLPPLPLGHNSIRELQTQLLELGFDPGPIDGEIGPATQAAVQRYDQSRGGNGSSSIDVALLRRLRQDDGPRLTPQQIAERSQPNYAVRRSSPFDDMMQQFQSGLRRLFNGGY